MNFQPSTYQQEIFRFVSEGRGDGIVNAVAGAGKTTTIVEAAKLIFSDGVFCAFNKHIVDSLQGRLYGTTMRAKTIHAIGMSALSKALNGKAEVDEGKYFKLTRAHVNSYRADFGRDQAAGSPVGDTFTLVKTVKRLAELAMLTLTDPANELAMVQLAHKYGLEYTPAISTAAATVIADGVKMAEFASIISFGDMLYLPYLWQLQPPRVGWVFIDECQDLAPAQLDLVLKLRSSGGRMLFVGDPFQAIQGFAGADDQSFWRIKETTGATELPLSICYRCPTQHIDIARQIVPQMEPKPDAAPGTIEYHGSERLGDLVREGDLILSRMNAPIIAECIKLIERQIPARVRGRDVGADLADLARQIGRKTLDHKTDFLPALADHEAHMRDFLVKTDASESSVEALADKCRALRACFAGAPDARSSDDLARFIESLFSDDRASVWLSTVHRSKGLEEKRVFILDPGRLGQRRERQQPWEFQQEMNLKYVALTRSKDYLGFLDVEGDHEQLEMFAAGERR